MAYMTNQKIRYISALKKIIIRPFLFLMLAMAVLGSSACIFLYIPFFQLSAAKIISARFGFELSSFEMAVKPGLHSLDLTISDVKGVDTSSLSSFGFSSVKYTLGYSQILSGCFYPEFLDVKGPMISMPASVPTGGGDGLRAALSSVYAFLDSRLPSTLNAFFLTDGNIILDDTSAENIKISFVRKDETAGNASFFLESDVIKQGSRIPVKADGEFFYDEGRLESAKINFSLSSLPIPMIPWPDSFRGTSGALNVKHLELEWHRGGTISSKGMISLPEAAFMLDAYEELKSMNLSATELSFEAELLKEAVDIRAFDIIGSDFSLSSSCYIPLDQGAKGMGLSVRSSMMPMRRFKALFPSPVTPTWIGTRLLPLFSEGKARLNHLVIEGSFDRITGMDRKENASSLFLDIDIDKIDIADFGGGLESKKVSANVLLDKGRLKISGVNGKIGGSIIRNAVYDYEDTYAEKSMENWYLAGNFSLPDLRVIAGAAISPGIVRDIAKDIIDARGSLDGDLSFSYHPDWDFIGITGGKIKSGALSLFHKKAGWPYVMKKLSVTFDEMGTAGLYLEGFLGASSAVITGKANVFNGNMELKGTALVDAFELSSLIKEKTGKVNSLALKGRQKTDFRFLSSAWKMSLDCDSDLEGLSGRLGSFILPPVKKDSSLKLWITGSRAGKWKIDGLKFHMDNGYISLSAPSGLGSLSQTAFSVDSFDLAGLGIYHEKNGLSFSGKLNGEILIKPDQYSPLLPEVFGEMDLSEAGIKMPGLPLVNKGDGRIVFSGQRVYTDELKLGLGGSFLDVMADLKGWDGIDGNVTIKSKSLSMPEFEDDGSSDELLPVLETDFSKKSDLKVNIEIDSVETPEKTRFGPVSAICLLNKGLLDIKNGKAVMPGGEIRFRLIQSEQDRASVTARAYIKIEKQDLKETLSYFNAGKNFSRFEHSTLSSDAYVYCSGKNMAELSSSLGGYVHMALNDGIAKQSSVMFKILSVLNLERFLHERPEGVPKEGFYFQSLDAGFKIKDGVLTTNDLVLKSPIINMGAAGSININNRRINMDVIASPLVTIDSVVSSLPFIGYILTGTDKALLSYYFKVKGPLDSPETSYIPLQKIPESILGYLKRIFMTPGRIPEEFQDIKDLILDRD